MLGGEELNMAQRLSEALLRLWFNRRAQDLVEYALAAAFVAVTASVFFPPAITPAISTVYAKIAFIFSRQP
jgi:hypothetical protein